VYCCFSQHFVDSIGRIEQQCRACYAGEVDFTKKEFIEMMVVDGCFIIELIHKASKEVQRDEEDPLFNIPCLYWGLYNDLILLENQLPWPVLDCLFNLTRSQAEQRSLSNLILSYFTFEWSPRDNFEHKHILDCIRNSYIGTCTVTPADTRVISYPEQIPSVIELVCAGVKFKVGDRNKYGLHNIIFKDGVMTIPCLFQRIQNLYTEISSHLNNVIQARTLNSPLMLSSLKTLLALAKMWIF
jgi:hypothetical protein